jgi:hypothetical protein
MVPLYDKSALPDITKAWRKGRLFLYTNQLIINFFVSPARVAR